MIGTKLLTKIDFTPITPESKELYERYLFNEEGRGCEFSFANLYCWGRQSLAALHGHILLFSQFGNRFVYPYPLGNGDKKAVLDAILADAAERGIPCCITGLSQKAKETVESLYPEKFLFQRNEGSFDYVYSIGDLADLPGKKYHGKRNHLNRFREAFPAYTVVPLDERNLFLAKKMAKDWYQTRLLENPDADYRMEEEALERAFREYRALKLEGLLLLNGEEALAFTMGSRLSFDTFDVHFEKARPDIQGAYAAINFEFARYIQSKYPDIRYLDREEDMGLAGLRRAKQSYHPHHMTEKYRAFLCEDKHEN